MIMHKSASSEKILLLHARLRHRRESILVPDLNARLVFVAAGYSQIKYTSLNQPELVLEVPSEYTLRWLENWAKIYIYISSFYRLAVH